MKFSLEQVKRMISVFPGEIVLYYIDKNQLAHIIYYSKGVPAFWGVSRIEYRRRIKKGVPIQKKGCEVDYMNQNVGAGAIPGEEEDRFYRMHHSKLGEIWFRSITRYVGDLDGNKIYCNILMDQSDESEDGYKILNTSKDSTIVYAKENNEILFVGDEFLALTGRKGQSYSGKKVYELFDCEKWEDCYEMLKRIVEQHEFYFEKVSRHSFQLELIPMIWRGYHAEAILLHDVTMLLKKQKNDRQTYQNRVKFMMSSEKDTLYTLYIDVSKNKLLELRDNLAEYINEEVRKPETVTEWMEETILPCICGEEDAQHFRKCFRRIYLLNCFKDGQTHFSFPYRLSKGGRMLVCEMEVELFQNPSTEHVEAYATVKNKTLGYVDQVVDKVLYREDYKMIGIISLKTQVVVIRSHRFEGLDIPTVAELPYQEVVNRVRDGRILKKEASVFDEYTKTDVIEKQLEVMDHYSFSMHNKENEVERYSYYWLDKKFGAALFVVDDMTHEIETDSLTGYPNRKGFFRHAGRILEENQEKKFVLLFFNIRHFKAINDMFGTETGDKILRDVLDRIQKCKFHPYAIARAESDHFLALVDADKFCEQDLTELLHAEFQYDNLKIEVYGRCGIYYIPQGKTSDIEEMCTMAKLAKTYIQNEYVKPYAVFDEDMKKRYLAESEAMNRLEGGLKRGEFVVYYQPIYDAYTEQVVAAEALIRWISPENKVTSPGVFLPALEESGYITKLDAYVNEKVQEFLTDRLKANQSLVPISINLSRMDLMDYGLLEKITQEVENSILPDHLIRYEITESAYTEISEKGKIFLDHLRCTGVEIMVDDFGSGVSSFSTIRDYDFDIIKLDMGFVQKIGTNKKVDNLVVSILEMIHRMNMKVVAEGVETKEQLEFLRTYGCDYIQGFYFSKPLPEAEFEKVLEKKGTVN